MMTAPMPGTSFRIFGRFFMPTTSSHMMRDEDLALGIERPDVGALVVLRLRQAPVARRSRGRVAALARAARSAARRRAARSGTTRPRCALPRPC